MPPRTALSTPLRGWRCPQCNLRAFTTTLRPRQIGPEHPDFIEVPEAPQQSSPYKPFIKGRLPVPRDILSGSQGRDLSSDEELARRTQRPTNPYPHKPGTREAWRQRLAESRRQALREGIKSLKARDVAQKRRDKEHERREQEEHQALRSMPERDSERLTAPSHGLDLKKLMRGPLPDPTRSLRLAQKARNLTLQAASKRATRLDHLHTLYTHARTFIVNEQQLEKEIEDVFGTDEEPVNFDGFANNTVGGGGQSVWAKGRPDSVQDMLNIANRADNRSALVGANGTGVADVNVERIRRIAEGFTGGRMEARDRG